MEKILEQLYKGELYPYSTFQTTIEDFKENRDNIMGQLSRHKCELFKKVTLMSS